MNKPFALLSRCLMGLLVVGALVVAAPAIVQACPTCKDQLASDANTSGVVAGYFWSILLMLSMPLVILGSLGAYVFYQLSQADAKLPRPQARAAAPASSSAEDREPVGA